MNEKIPLIRQLTVQMSPALYSKLQAYAAERQVSMSALVRMWIDQKTKRVET